MFHFKAKSLHKFLKNINESSNSKKILKLVATHVFGDTNLIGKREVNKIMAKKTVYLKTEIDFKTFVHLLSMYFCVCAAG